MAVQAERAKERPEGAAGGRDGVFRRVQTADRRGEHGGAACGIGTSAHQLWATTWARSAAARTCREGGAAEAPLAHRALDR
jgi:hypothetical protein